MNLQEIDPKKIKWIFWQKSYGYDYGDGLFCLFNSETQYTIDDCAAYYTGGNFGKYIDCGTFSIYKTIKMTSGEFGIDKTRPLMQISISKENKKSKLNEFNVYGIWKVYDLLKNNQ